MWKVVGGTVVKGPVSGAKKQVAAAGGLLWRNGERGLWKWSRCGGPRSGTGRCRKASWTPASTRSTAACREVEEETGIPVIPQLWLCRASYVLPNPRRGHSQVGRLLVDAHREARCGVHGRRRDRGAALDHVGGGPGGLTRPRDQQVLKTFSALPAVTATVLLAAPAEAEQGWDGAGGDAAVELARAGPGGAVGGARGAVPAGSVLQRDRARERADAGADRAGGAVPPQRATRCSTPKPTNAIRSAPACGLRELAGGGGAAIVCAEPEVVSDTVAILADEDGVETPDVSTRPGEAWVLSLSGQKLVGSGTALAARGENRQGSGTVRVSGPVRAVGAGCRSRIRRRHGDTDRLRRRMTVDHVSPPSEAIVQRPLSEMRGSADFPRSGYGAGHGGPLRRAPSRRRSLVAGRRAARVPVAVPLPA